MTMHGGAPSQQKIDHDRHRRDEYRRVLEQQIQEKKDRELRSREAREGSNSNEPLPWQRQAQVKKRCPPSLPLLPQNI